MQIDLNCDLGEGFPHDAELMPLITSASVCCGFHAGSPDIALATLRLAARHHVQVGAHPGYVDRESMGRRELALPEEEVYTLCVYQVGALAGLARSAGLQLAYLKPHGALYNQACRDDAFARPVLAAAAHFGLPLLALPSSRLHALSAGRSTVLSEGFADRRYLPDGSLVPRTRPDALLEDADAAVAQAEWLIRDRGIRTLCIHGDNPHAVSFLHSLRTALLHHGITIHRFDCRSGFPA